MNDDDDDERTAEERDSEELGRLFEGGNKAALLQMIYLCG
jgi:hypothetical protein